MGLDGKLKSGWASAIRPGRAVIPTLHVLVWIEALSEAAIEA